MRSFKPVKSISTLLLTASFCCICFHLKSQSSVGADAAGLSKYGEMPVSLHTGTGGASIDLAVATGRELSIPIGLSYHAGGIRVKERASRVGLGWSLNAGGVITRSVYGMPDEKSYLKRSANTKQRLLTGNYTNPMQNPDQYLFLDSVMNGTVDTQPDAFFFNIGGKSGRFHLTPEGKPVLEDYESIVISFGTNLEYFSIVDESGTRYEFRQKEGSTSRSRENYMSAWGIPSEYVVSAWYLTSITSTTGEKIELGYRIDESNGNNGYISEKSYNEGVKKILTGSSSNLHKIVTGYPLRELGSQNDFQYYGQYGYTSPNLETETRTASILLDRISYEGGYIKFTYSGRGDIEFDKKLDMIAIYAWDGYSYSRLVNRIYFEYDYYTNLSNEQDEYRLRLKGIHTVNNLQQKTQPYLFEYERNTLPFFNSLGIDHWGYYNGKEGNITLTPTTTVDGVQYLGGNRGSDFEFAKWGILTKITYPSGSSTTFEYEAHKNSSGTVLGGGLRIRGIVSKDENNLIAFQKQYEYGDNYCQTPLPVYQYAAKQMYTQIIGNNQPTVMADVVVLTSYDNTVLGMGAGQVYYKSVTEIIGEKQGTVKFKNEYEYYYNPNPDIDHPNSPPDDQYLEFPFVQVRINHPLNGSLVKMRAYGFDGTLNRYYRIKETENLHVVEPFLNRSEIPCFKVSPFLLSPFYIDYYGGIPSFFNGVNPFHPVVYTLRAYWSHPSETIERTYPDPADSDKYIENRTRYVFGNRMHAQPTQVETINSEQTKTIVKLKYAFDYQDTYLTDQESSFIKQMKSKNIVSESIEQQIWQKKTGEALPKLMGGQLTAYDPVFFKPIKIWATELEEPVAGLDREGFFMSDSQRYLPKTTYHYDGKGNILSQDILESGQTKSYYWNRNRQYLLAEADLAKPEQIFHTSFEEEEAGGNVVAGDAKTGNKSWIGGFSKNLANLPAGPYTLSYWYKADGKWVLGTQDIDIVGQGSTGLGNYQISLSINQVDEIRFHPKTALMKTYTYEPGVGITSQTDSNHRTNYYEYDGFGRIRLIRDEYKNILQKYDYRIRTN